MLYVHATSAYRSAQVISDCVLISCQNGKEEKKMSDTINTASPREQNQGQGTLLGPGYENSADVHVIILRQLIFRGAIYVDVSQWSPPKLTDYPLILSKPL